MQKTSLNPQKILRNGILLFLSFCMLHSASSASYSSGGGNKKDSKSSTSLNLKSTPLSFSNGYRFRSGMSFSTTSNNLVFKSNTIRFQKGNSLYIIPVKQKVIISKFKTPQKEIK